MRNSNLTARLVLIVRHPETIHSSRVLLLNVVTDIVNIVLQMKTTYAEHVKNSRKSLSHGLSIQDSLQSEKDSLQEEKESEIQKLSNSSTEMSMKNLEDRARFCHLSTNLQLVSFLTLILFSKIILNLAHGIEVITYSFFVMLIYNLIRRFYRDFPLSKTYILDIFGTMAILLICINLSNLISGTQAIILAVLISGFFVVRMLNIGLILQSRTSGFSEFKTRLDYSAIGFTISCILCVVILYF